MPGVATVFRWLRKHPDFAEIYSLAKQTQAMILIDRCLDLVDDTSHDLIKDEKGRFVPNRAHFQRIKIQIAHYQWAASKLLPRVYGNGKHPNNEERRTKNQEQTSPPPPNDGIFITEERRQELIERRHRAFVQEAIRAAEASATPPAHANSNEGPNSNEAPSTKNQEQSVPLPLPRARP
jgi:hypothetical protein